MMSVPSESWTCLQQAPRTYHHNNTGDGVAKSHGDKVVEKELAPRHFSTQ